MSKINGYQGQIRAIDQTNHKFTQNQDLFELIRNDSSAETVQNIIRLGIQDFPSPYQPIQPGESSGFKVIIGKNGKNQIIQIGFNSMFEIRDVPIDYFVAASNSSDRVIIDYIIQEGAS